MKPARDWNRLLREGLSEGVAHENLSTYIADNTDDPRTSGGFPPGYHAVIDRWVAMKTIGIFRKSGSFVRLVGFDKKMLEVERIDTGKKMTIPADSFDTDGSDWDGDTREALRKIREPG